MATISAIKRQNAARRIIVRWGGTGKLNRDGVRRSAVMAIVDWTPRERAGGLVIENAVRIRVACPIAIPPEFDKDVIEFGGFSYRIADKPRGPLIGNTVVFYDCNAIEFTP